MVESHESHESHTSIKEIKYHEVDGSLLEGGGQILRISLALAVLTNSNVKISKIRNGRSSPGLQAQHLYNSLSIAEMFYYKIKGAELKSKEISLEKLNVENFELKENYLIDLTGAGSIGLVIQQFLPLLMLYNIKDKSVSLDIIGGTLVNFSPSTYYLNSVLFPLFEKLYNSKIKCEVQRHGLFPIGKGKVRLSIDSSIEEFNNIKIIERGKLIKVLFRIIHTSNLDEDIKEIYTSLNKDVKKILKSNNFVLKSTEDSKDDNSDEEKHIDCIEYESILERINYSKGYTVAYELVLYYENTIIYHEVKESEKKIINKNSLREMKQKLLFQFEDTIDNDYFCFDEYTLDHLIIFMALAKGESIVKVKEISKHAETAIFIVKQFLNSLVELEYLDEGGIILKIQGSGIRASRSNIIS